MSYAEYERISRQFARTVIDPESVDALTVLPSGKKRELRKFAPKKHTEKIVKNEKKYYTTPDLPVDVDSPEEADLIISLTHQDSFFTYHAPLLDLDIPHKYIASTTEGHGHLYLDVELPWHKYVKLLKVLAECGIIEEGYVNASIAREYTAVRPPWKSKEPINLPHPSEMQEALPESEEAPLDNLLTDPAIAVGPTTVITAESLTVTGGSIVAGAGSTWTWSTYPPKQHLTIDYPAPKQHLDSSSDVEKEILKAMDEVEAVSDHKEIPEHISYTSTDVVAFSGLDWGVLHSDGSGTWYGCGGSVEPLEDFNVAGIKVALGTATAEEEEYADDGWEIVKKPNPVSMFSTGGYLASAAYVHGLAYTPSSLTGLKGLYFT